MTSRVALGPLTLIVLLTAATRVAAQGQPGGAAADSPAGRTAGPQAAQPGAKAVEEGLFPKSFRIPGTDLSLAIGGYVKVDFIQDFSGIGNAFEFKTNTIAIEGTPAADQTGRTTIHARETRLNFDVRSSGTGRHHFRAFVEADFFGDGNAFRLRHAFGEFGPILGGQTWSTFQDISARGLTLDFEGPDGEVFVRQAMIRFTHKIDEHWTVAVAAENPSPQFVVPSDLTGSPSAAMPDIPAYVRYQRGGGHVQLAALVRQLRFDGTGAAEDATATGWGLNATFGLPVPGGDQVFGQFAIGDGTGRYIEGLSGQNLDAVLLASGEIHGLRTQSGHLSYIRHWSPALKSGVAFSTSFVENDPALTPATIDRLMDFRANLIWTPYRVVDFGGELLWGERRNKSGASGEAWRFHAAVIYRLN